MKKVIFLTVACFISLGLIAQMNVQNFRIDQMTDAQIEQYMKQAELMGYSEIELPAFARSQGVSPIEIQKLQDRLKQIKANKVQSVNNVAKPLSRQVNMSETRDSARSNVDTVTDRVFGSNLFRNNNITFEPNLRMATPSSYIIGPDDELLLDITGDNEASYKLPVSPEGTIKVEYVGIIPVSGLSIGAAREKVTQRLSGTYPSIRSGRTQVNINVGNIRSIRVTITGAAAKPGTYTLPSLATVFNALYASGGPAENGSYRNIQVIRNNSVVSTIDVYDFLVNGMQKGNIRIQDQDIIHIPIYGHRVEFQGEVKRPAIFEGKEGESLLDLVRYAGGFTENAYTSKIKVFQKTDKERRITDIYADQFSSYKLKNGDNFVAEALLDRYENRVSILGAVFRSGVYGLEDGMTLRDVLQLAQGVREDAFLERGLINRLRADNSLEMINFNLREVLAGNAPDILLKREDRIEISSIFDLRDEYKFTIQGQVRLPGDFPYASNTTVSDIIQKAGGLTEEAKNARIEIARRIKNRGAQDSVSAQTILIDIRNGVLDQPDIKLRPYDVVTILGDANYRVQRQVKIEGEVMYPGIYTINREDERISDLIKRAGGLTAYAYVEGASLRRTGSSKVKEEAKKAREEQLKAIGKDLKDNSFESELEDGEEKGASGIKQKEQTLAKATERGATPISLETSDLVGIELHKILKTPYKTGDLLLLDGDIVTVPKELQTVRVMGEVLHPNNVVYQKGKPLSYYINQAGGYTSEALKKKTFVQYANGSVKGSSGNSPTISPGAEIIVPKRAPKERMSAQSWIGLGTGVASLAAIIVSLLRN